jgi:catechol 2,3-dioxygenase-like lactoylglutathione lyase family enzyme
MLPYVNLRPPFNITRSSHVRLTVADVAESRNFYMNVIGLVVSDEDDSVCYLRGLAEACHHSLVLEQAREGGTCRRIGFRVFFDEDLDAAYDYFRQHDLAAEWVEMPHQGRTLHVSDPFGTPLELCATMENRPRMHIRFETFKGAHAQRLDHYQILAPDAYESCAFYSALGFRSSEYLADGDTLLGTFMYRKGTCLDLASSPVRVRGYTTSRTQFRRATTSLMPAISRGTWATVPWSNAVPDATGRVACCSPTSATPTGIGSRSSTATTRPSTSRPSRCAGMRNHSAQTHGGACQRWRSGTSRPRRSTVSPFKPRAHRRTH